MVWLSLPLSKIIINICLAILDITIISFMFYKFYQILAQTKAVQVIKGLVFFIVLYLISRFLEMETFSWILDQLAAVIVLAVIILFQPELRRVLTKLGQSNWISTMIRKNPKDLNYILTAIENCHIRQIGAILVFERTVGLKNIIESGTVLNAKISSSLLLTVFTNKTPLHDGAVIVKNDQIIAAGCFLPLSDSKDLKQEIGTRHRAALGLSEETDAIAVVVSEETGNISLAYDGKLYSGYDQEMLRKDLCNLLGYDESDLGDSNEEIEV